MFARCCWIRSYFEKHNSKKYFISFSKHMFYQQAFNIYFIKKKFWYTVTCGQAASFHQDQQQDNVPSCQSHRVHRVVDSASPRTRWQLFFRGENACLRLTRARNYGRFSSIFSAVSASGTAVQKVVNFHISPGPATGPSSSSRREMRSASQRDGDR